jgi:hypothetical protein
LFSHASFMLLYFFGWLHVLTFLYPQKIKNPNYKGKWKIPWIDNPGKEMRITDVHSALDFEVDLLSKFETVLSDELFHFCRVWGWSRFIRTETFEIYWNWSLAGTISHIMVFLRCMS